MNEGHLDEAAAKREAARNLLTQISLDSEQFGRQVQNVAQLYQNVGMTAKARAVMEDALARMEASGQPHPESVMLLTTLSGFWQQDGNLLKSTALLEKAVAVSETAPPSDRPVAGRVVAIFGNAHSGSFPGGGDWIYQRLAEQYRQLGRPEAAAKIIAKMQERSGNNPAALASLYENQGQFDEAAAIYKRQAAEAAANSQSQPWQMAAPLQNLANLYQRQQRFDDAAAALQEAIATFSTSSNAGIRNQAIGLRENLANLLNQAGKTEAADQIYTQLLADSHGDPNESNVMANYANYLAMTKRGGQAESMLNDYLSSQSNLEPWQESNLLFSLANAARSSGQQKRAEDYQQRGEEKQRSMNQNPQQPRFLIGKDLQAAQSAAQKGSIDDAFSLALQAMDAAARASDRDQVSWQVPTIATVLVQKAAPDKAQQLYDRLFALVDGWSATSPQSLINVRQQYLQFLMQQKNRAREIPAAIDQYKEALVAAHGPASSLLEQVFRQTAQFEQRYGSPQKAVAASLDALAFEESLSGNTSEPYMRVMEEAARAYQSAGDFSKALPLWRQTVAISDLVYAGTDIRRAHTRMNVAMTLARQRQFDEAEQLAQEALAVGQKTRPPQTDQLTKQMEQIEKMKNAPQQPQQQQPATRAFRTGAWFLADPVPAAALPPAPAKPQPEN